MKATKSRKVQYVALSVKAAQSAYLKGLPLYVAEKSRKVKRTVAKMPNGGELLFVKR